MKINKKLIESACRVTSVKLSSGASLAEITDAAYAMNRAVDSGLGMKGNMKPKIKKDNKRIRRLKENAMEQRQGVTRISSELRRRRIRSKAAWKKRKVLEKLIAQSGKSLKKQ